jgi:hypothetical protein
LGQYTQSRQKKKQVLARLLEKIIIVRQGIKKFPAALAL